VLTGFSLPALSLAPRSRFDFETRGRDVPEFRDLGRAESAARSYIRRTLARRFAWLKDGGFFPDVDRLPEAALTHMEQTLLTGLMLFDPHPLFQALDFEALTQESNLPENPPEIGEWVKNLNRLLESRLPFPFRPLVREDFIFVNEIISAEEFDLDVREGRAFNALQKILLSVEAFSRKKNRFGLLLHEVVHLLFPGFPNRFLNESLTEYIASELLLGRPPRYYRRKVALLKEIFAMDPSGKIRDALLLAYTSGNLARLRNQLGEDLFLILTHMDELTLFDRPIELVFQDASVMEFLLGELREMAALRKEHLALIRRPGPPVPEIEWIARRVREKANAFREIVRAIRNNRRHLEAYKKTRGMENETALFREMVAEAAEKLRLYERRFPGTFDAALRAFSIAA
jgi:hypothetical protein